MLLHDTAVGNFIDAYFNKNFFLLYFIVGVMRYQNKRYVWTIYWLTSVWYYMRLYILLDLTISNYINVCGKIICCAVACRWKMTRGKSVRHLWLISMLIAHHVFLLTVRCYFHWSLFYQCANIYYLRWLIASCPYRTEL